MLKRHRLPGQKELIFELVQREKGGLGGGKYAILQTWIKQKRCRWVGLAGGILETGQLHFPHAVGVSLRTDGTLGSPKKTPVKRLPCRSIRHTSRRSAGVRHTLLYSHRARENKQPAACKMSGTVGSDFKKIIKGPL